MLPGTLCTAAVFDDFLDALAVAPAQRHPLILDRPSVEDYVDLCPLASQDTVVCGFSLGAIVAAHLADRMTAHRLVLFGINPYANDPAKAKGRRDLAHDVALLGGADAMRSRLPDLHGPDRKSAKVKMLAMADQTAPLIDAQTQLALNRPGALPALSRARAPVFSLTGSNDLAAPPAQGRAAAEAAPMGQFASLDGLGHFALLENPMACAASVARMEEYLHNLA